MLAPRPTESRPFVAVLAVLVVGAWLSLFAWGASPYGRYLSHETMSSVPDASWAGVLGISGLLIGGWLLMIVAMMLPTAFPLVLLFRRLTAARADRRVLSVALIGGYLAAWAIVGVALHIGDALIHLSVGSNHWMRDNAWAITAGTLLLAGAYQFSPLKYLCLDECRSPYTFIAGRWQGGNPMAEALSLGFAHGWFCVGCCWTLMVVMFGLGSGSLAWMLGIGAVMVIEKNTPWGRAVSTPLGAVLLAAGVSVILLNLGVGTACAHDGTTC